MAFSGSPNLNKPWPKSLLIIIVCSFQLSMATFVTAVYSSMQILALVFLPICLALSILLSMQYTLRYLSPVNRHDLELLDALKKQAESFNRDKTKLLVIEEYPKAKFNAIAQCIGRINRRQLRCETEVEELSIQVQEKNDQLRAQQKIHLDRNENLHKMFAGASHDLRQPLQAMVIFISAIQETATKQQAPLLQKLEQVVENLNHMFTDLLDSSKLESRMKRIPKQNVDIQQLLTKVCDEFEALANDKNIQLRTKLRDLSVYSNANMLERIIRNMLSNAIRYTRKGGVLVGCRRHRDETWIEVWDTGRGIPKEKLEIIFDEFVQINEHTEESQQGVGLGLFIVKRLAQLLDHKIIVRSTLNQGTLFRVIIPTRSTFALPPPSKIEMFKAKPTLQHFTDGNLKILLIDDEAHIRDSISKLLAGWGMEVMTLDSVQAISNVTPASLAAIDVVISDYQLGDDDTGLEAITLIRQKAEREIPAMIVTGTENEEHLNSIKNQSIPLLKKPVKPAKLRALLNMLSVG